MKLQAKGKKKRKEQEAQKDLEENVPVVTREVEPLVYYKGEIPSREIKQVLADEVEMIYEELGLVLNRPSAEAKALNIVRHLRLKAKVKFSEV